MTGVDEVIQQSLISIGSFHKYLSLPAFFRGNSDYIQSKDLVTIPEIFPPSSICEN